MQCALIGVIPDICRETFLNESGGNAGRSVTIKQPRALPLIGMNEVLINESLIGLVMRARVLCETRFGAFSAVVPEVSGSAHVYGQGTWMLDRHDPLRHGFLVR
jgi:trans-L-3-hydroxyproline dehydratase